MNSLDRVNETLAELNNGKEDVLLIPPVEDHERGPLLVSGCKMQDFPEIGEGFPAKSIVSWQ